MKLSKRLLAVASMVSEGKVTADVGTDHGYVPIYLVKQGICPFAYACDVNKGPLDKAREHIVEEEMEDKIFLQLSDGMKELKGKDIESVIIAGMGGELICKIIEESPILDDITELIVSPHHDVNRVRETLLDNGFNIVSEKMILDSDKYYNIIKSQKSDKVDSYTPFELKYSKKLFEEKDEVFKEYLKNMMNKYSIIISRLENSRNEETNRKNEILTNMDECKKALEMLEV